MASDQDTDLRHVLYIDDEPDILSIATLCLETMGNFTVSARASAEGLDDMIDQLNPDLVILDVMMPVIDGPSALLKLRRDGRHDDVPVIFMTARIQPEEVRQYIEMGAIGVMPKPFDPMRLHTDLLNLWRTYKHAHQAPTTIQ